MKPYVAIALCLAVTAPAQSQELAKACTAAGQAAGGTTVKRQPRIIVVPFTKSGEDIRTVLEADINRRVAVTKIQEAFDRHGFSAGDYIGIVRGLSVRQGSPLSQSDLLSQVFEISRADIYVEVEINVEQSGNLRSAVAIMRGYLTANGLSLGNKIGRSPKQQLATEVSRLVEVATGAENVDPLLDLMQQKFDEYTENGVPITVDISAREGSKVRPGSDVAGKNATVADLLEDWMRTHAWKGIFNVSMSTDTRMSLDEVRIPMLEPTTCRNNSPLRFGRDIVAFLRTMNISASSAVNGGSLLIELR
ncbi:MAG: DUF6175 family protein [Gemmatimonadaceae bacterium]